MSFFRDNGTFARVTGTKDYKDTWSANNNATTALVTLVALIENALVDKLIHSPLNILLELNIY